MQDYTNPKCHDLNHWVGGYPVDDGAGDIFWCNADIMKESYNRVSVIELSVGVNRTRRAGDMESCKRFDMMFKSCLEYDRWWNRIQDSVEED